MRLYSPVNLTGNLIMIYLFIYLFKQLVSRHNVNHTKNSYRRIAGADKPRDQPAKCLVNKKKFQTAFECSKS